MDLGALIKGKHVFVTGASGGLGAHFARLYAANGAVVSVGARRADRLASLVEELRQLGAAQALAVSLDVADEASVAAAVSEAEAALGPIDVVVNNAGISRPYPALQLSAPDFDDVIATNLRGVWLVCADLGRRWQKAGRPGVIVNIASILAERVAGALVPYAASKAAVVQMTKALALEWARYGIRVNALAPGYIETDINSDFFHTETGEAMVKRIPMRRLGRPQELDGALLLLSTDASSWMTGEVIAVDGGHRVSTL
ncbi:SDR family NAD(P)-dependent oxidoreductase [Chelatococcus reniformis]|uniref:3-oxoacyl-ACP reductase n=1 Tax=Chelatococcus reniformis TaxID=1494448 RepID=A0A916XI81_9HYPH|nr:SDR family NAD(P)-dependent oxidoreductase [Chelatococcus reniformis]GGC73901.1 3-oxoacyl-ACP reductase [Chelatococcus reniformis]